MAFAWGFASILLVALAFLPLAAIPAILVAIVASSCLYLHKTHGSKRLAENFRHSQFSIQKTTELVGPNASEDIDFLDTLPGRGQNLIIYSGFLPFVGSGFDLDGWSIMTFIDRPKSDGEVSLIERFTTSEIDLAVDEALKKLSFQQLSCDPLYFIRGVDVRDDLSLLDLYCRPVQQLEPERGDELVKLGLARAYKRIQVVEWGGDIVLTQYFRCFIQGRSLYLELRQFVLPPLARAYRDVDFLAGEAAAKHIQIAQPVGEVATSLIFGPASAIVAPFLVFGQIQEHLGRVWEDFLGRNVKEERAAKRLREIDTSGPLEFGTAASLRAQFAQQSFAHYYQKIDADLTGKAIERTILDVIERFLDDHGIDTTDFREKQTTILTAAFFVQGGDVRAESIAVGQGARASKVDERPSSKPRPSQ